MKKTLSILLALMLVLSLCACQDGTAEIKDPVKPGVTLPPEQDPNTPITYTVTVSDEEGEKLEGIYVVIALGYDYSCGGGMTDENGVATIELVRNEEYEISLMAVPDEYEVEPAYYFTGTEANIILKKAN